jgi:hypothetical protein
MSQHGNIMNPSTGDYMDAQGPPQGGGYMMQIPQLYDVQQHYNANGS